MASYVYDRTGDRVDLGADDNPDLGRHPDVCDQGWIEVAGQPGVFRHCPVCRALTVQERSQQAPRRTP